MRAAARRGERGGAGDEGGAPEHLGERPAAPVTWVPTVVGEDSQATSCGLGDNLPLKVVDVGNKKARCVRQRAR